MESTYVFIPKENSGLKILTITVFFNDMLCEGSAKQLIREITNKKAEDYDIGSAVKNYFTPN